MVERFRYSIVYVMPRGSRVGLYEVMTEKEAEDTIRRLKESGCTIGEVHKEKSVFASGPEINYA